MQDWDDLRIFIAAARACSLTKAARQLGIDTATVGRRVGRLESSLKATLFVRSRNGLQLTAAGGRLLEAALNVEEAMTEAARSGEADVVGGTVRISVAEGFGSAIIAPELPLLRKQRPGLRIELAAAAGFLSPTRREVDLAVTLSAPTSSRAVIEPLTDYELGLYASPAYLRRMGSPEIGGDLHRFDMVGYVDDLIYAPELRYLDELEPLLRPALASTSIVAQQRIIKAGGGIGILPCFLAPGLVRVLPEVKLTRRFWISTHREVASTARVKAVHHWLRDVAARHAELLRPSS